MVRLEQIFLALFSPAFLPTSLPQDSHYWQNCEHYILEKTNHPGTIPKIVWAVS